MPLGIGLGVSAAATVGSGIIQSNAANKATNAAATANANNLAFQNQVYNTGKANLQPFVNTGQQANSALSGLVGTAGDPAASDAAFKNYLGSTNYKFQLGQGLQGIEYANAPAFNSSATAKALNNYAQGQAGSALSGYESMLQGQATTGAGAAGTLGGLGVNVGTQNASTNNNLASAQISQAGTQSNAASNALTGLSKLINQANTQSSFGNGGALSGFSNASTDPTLQGLI